MAWRIRLSDLARPAYEALDGSLQEELRLRAIDLAEEPMASLRRSRPPAEDSGLLVYEYWSEVVPGLLVALYFDGQPDAASQILVLVAIRHRMRLDPDEDSG